MGFNLTAFAGGFAEGLVEDIEKEEKLAETRAVAGVKNMYESYQKTMEENRKLKNELLTNIDTLRTYDSKATDDELFEIAKSKPLMELISSKVKSGDFANTNFRLADFATIAATNNPTTARERVDELFKTASVINKVAPEQEKEKPLEGNFVQRMISASGSRAGKTAASQTAEVLGVSLDQMQSTRRVDRNDIQSAAVANMEKFAKQPNNIKDITDSLEVSMVQAAQKYGADSTQVKDLAAQLKFVKSYESADDKTREQRLERLSLQAYDETDPVKKKVLETEVKALATSIRATKQLTSIKDPAEKEKTMAQIRSSLNDYVFTRMREEEGFKWKDYVEFKQTKNEVTGEVMTSRIIKNTKDVEGQKKVFARERELMAEALKTNGYVARDGTPRYSAVAEVMNNYMITAKDLYPNPEDVPGPAPSAPAPAPAQNKAASPQRPTAIPTTINQQDFDEKWKKLGPGQQLTGPDGKVYTKAKG